MADRTKDEWGSCKNCGIDLNGERVYDIFYKKYQDHDRAADSAEMFGCTKDWGRFGKAIHMHVDDGPNYFKCPECGERCY